MFSALAWLTWEGRMPQAVTLEVIDRFEREDLAPDGDLAWEGWQNAIMYLGLEDRADKVQTAWAAEHLTFHNEDNGFCILRVKARCHRDLVTME